MTRVVLVPLLAPVFVLVYGVLFLSAPGSTANYVPYALVTGPVAIVGFFLLGIQHRLLWLLLGGTYALYVVYAALLRARVRRGADLAPALTAIVVLHAVCGMLFLYFAIHR